MKKMYRQWIEETFSEIWDDFFLFREIASKENLIHQLNRLSSLIVAGYFKKQWKEFYLDDFRVNVYKTERNRIVDEIINSQKRVYFQLDFDKTIDYQEKVAENNAFLKESRLVLDIHFIKTLDLLIKDFRNSLKNKERPKK